MREGEDGKTKDLESQHSEKVTVQSRKKDVFLALPPSFTNNFSILLQLLCHSLTFKKMTHILDVEVFFVTKPSLPHIFYQTHNLGPYRHTWARSF